MRLFFAVELPDDVRAALARLRPRDDAGDYRWADPAGLHVTLAFLGEQPEDRLQALEQVGKEAASHSNPGVLRLGATGSFGSHRAPRVLWVDVAGDIDALLDLQKQLDGRLRQHGFPTEDRPFVAHITLARRREQARGGTPAGWPPQPLRETFPLDKLMLMQSRLSPRGATYTPVFQFPIGG